MRNAIYLMAYHLKDISIIIYCLAFMYSTDFADYRFYRSILFCVRKQWELYV